MSVPRELADANPFATARVAPGAIPYRFATGESVAQVTRRLESFGGWGQIVGPHGTGKSTLVRTLIATLNQAGTKCLLTRVGPGERRWSAKTATAVPAALESRTTRGSTAGGPLCLAEATPGTQVFVDGFEQLSGWSRWTLKRYCRKRGLRLVVTAHRDLGLPLLASTEANRELAWALVEQLIADFPPLIQTADLEALWAAHPSNVREFLFGLYDLYERRRRSIGTRGNS